MNASSPFSLTKGLLAIAAALLLLNSSSLAQQPETAPHVLRLQNVTAAQALRLVEELMGQGAGPKAKLRIAADERTNSLVIVGQPLDVMAVTKLIEKIDVPGREQLKDAAVFEVLALGHLEPDRSLTEALRILVPPPGRFVINHDRRTLLVYSSPGVIGRVRAVLARLEEAAPASALRVPTHVRVFWVVSAASRERVAGLPAEIGEVAGDLAALGLVRPHLAAELAAAVTPGEPFEVSGLARLHASCGIALTGSLTELGGSARLDVRIIASGRAAKHEAELGRLRTQLTVSPGRPVVLGAMPVDGRPAAFVALVAGAAPGAKTAVKKVSFPRGRQPWPAVFRWLSDQSGLPIIAATWPAGTFDFAPPQTPKGPRQYTFGEVFDILNEALLPRDYYLVRSKSLFILISREDLRANPGHERYLPADVAGLPKTWCVSVTFPLHRTAAKHAAQAVKKLLGPLGEVVVLDSSNSLVVQDTVANLRRIHEFLQESERKRAATGQHKAR
jgi:hypothetical protein